MQSSPCATPIGQEWQRRLSPYLSLRARELLLCRSQTHCCLAHKRVRPQSEKCKWEGPMNGAAEYWQELPLSDKACAVLLIFEWRDQGGGNRKGTLAILSGKGKLGPDFSPWPAEAVAWVGPAEHKWCRDTLVFQPVKNATGVERHSLWIRAGGGGGHALAIQNLTVVELVVHVTPNVERTPTHEEDALLELLLKGLQKEQENSETRDAEAGQLSPASAAESSGRGPPVLWTISSKAGSPSWWSPAMKRQYFPESI